MDIVMKTGRRHGLCRYGRNIAKTNGKSTMNEDAQNQADDAALVRAAERMKLGVVAFREFPSEDLIGIIRIAMQYRNAVQILHEEKIAAGETSMALGPARADNSA
jgi:hypothetical protein